MPRRGSTPPLPATYRHEASDQSKPHPPSKSRMQFPQSPHTRRHKNGRISTTQVHHLKCPEGNCMRNLSPADERSPQGLRTHIHTLTVSAFNSTSTVKLSPHAFLAISPVQNSPNRSPLAALPRQNSPSAAENGPFLGILALQGEFCLASRSGAGLLGEFSHAATVDERSPPGPVVVVPGKQQAPENSHVIRLKEVSTNTENVAIPTRCIKDLKQSQGNYVRNW